MSSTQARWWAQEDWLSVWLGAASLILVAAGVKLSPLTWVNAIGLMIVSLPGALLLGANAMRYAAGFFVVFALAWVAQFIAAQKLAVAWGIEYVIFALLIGLAVSNLIGVPDWLKAAVRTEYFIKTGLVIFGATILFQDILQAGFLGMLQAVVVVAVIWYFSFWLCKKVRLDDEFSAMLSTAVSICGVSAAIAACGAIQGDRRRLSYIASVVLIVAAPMIVLMPWLSKTFGLPDAVAGAWLGGTLDTTGSVVAAGSLISETAMKVGTIVKFSQNVLIGLAAFLLSIWWSMKDSANGGERPSAKVIWERFPKFVIGFMAASLIFSFAVSPVLVKSTKGIFTSLRNVWFAMAFTCIGLETKFTDLWSMEGGRPLVAFLGAQTANVIWTLLLAWLIFGGVFFAVPKI